MLISNASAIGKGTVRIVISPFYSHANEKTEFIVICVLTVKMYFRPFLGSGRITPPNWTRAPGLSIVTTPHMDYR
ncbi:hypothetical protein PS2_035351 [Malus domestica]